MKKGIIGMGWRRGIIEGLDTVTLKKEAAMTHAMSAIAMCFCKLLGGEHYRDKNARITKATPLLCCSIYPKHYKRKKKGGENSCRIPFPPLFDLHNP